MVGFLHAGSAKPNAHLVAAFLRGLEETGFKEGRNVSVEYRWAEGKYESLPQLASDLAGRHVAVFYTAGCAGAAASPRLHAPIAAVASTVIQAAVRAVGMGDPARLQSTPVFPT